MTTTTYDQIWTCFLENCGFNRNDLPQSEERIYSMINNAKDYYNNIMKKHDESYQTNLECDDIIETLNVELSSDELLIFANIIKLIFLKNKYTEFCSTWSVFSKELGINNYRDQERSKKELVKAQEEEIDNLINNALDDWEI